MANTSFLQENAHITVRDLSIGYNDFTVMKNLNFTIKRGDVFVIMGASGCKIPFLKSLSA